MTDHGTLDDAAVAALTPEPWGPLVRATAPDGAPAGTLVLQNMTSVAGPDDLSLLADVPDADGARATDSGGYRVTGDVVIVWDAGDDTVTISRIALADLLQRLVAAAPEA